jgi:branched-chain amino acid transport system ATP-binding protein
VTDVTAARLPDALVLDQISAGYGQGLVLQDVTLTVPASTVVALIGPNGAGKSTLLRTASGLLSAQTGSVRLGGSDLLKEFQEPLVAVPGERASPTFRWQPPARTGR